MIHVVALLFTMFWTSCIYTMDFSELCVKCVLDTCTFKVGLLAEFLPVEATAFDEATSVVNSAAELQTKWPMQL